MKCGLKKTTRDFRGGLKQGPGGIKRPSEN